MSQPVSRIRRATISVGIIAYCLVVITYLAANGAEFPLGEETIKGMFSLAEMVVMFYIGGSVVDSTNIAGLLASRGASKPTPPPPKV